MVVAEDLPPRWGAADLLRQDRGHRPHDTEENDAVVRRLAGAIEHQIASPTARSRAMIRPTTSRCFGLSLRWTVMPVRNVVSHAVIEFRRRKHAEACSCHRVRHGVYQGLDVGVGVGRGAGALGWRILSHSSPRLRTKRLPAPVVAAASRSRGDDISLKSSAREETRVTHHAAPVLATGETVK